MRLISILIFGAALLFAPSAFAADENRAVNVRVLLVLASNESGQTDSQLAPYEPTLRRILRFDTYRLAGSGQATVGTEAAQIGLGRGHSLQIEQEGGRGTRLRVRWEEGGRTLMSTGLSLRAGVPAVLGGPPSGEKGQVWAVILVAR